MIKRDLIKKDHNPSRLSLVDSLRFTRAPEALPGLQPASLARGCRTHGPPHIARQIREILGHANTHRYTSVAMSVRAVAIFHSLYVSNVLNNCRSATIHIPITSSGKYPSGTDHPPTGALIRVPTT